MSGPREATVGDVIDGRYLLRREIARGGMGTVYEAEQQVTGRVVAVKLVHRRTRYAKMSEERLLREARAITAVRHPGIVELLDAGICKQAGPYLALEMLTGRTLDGIIAARGRLPIDDVVHLGRQMCEALAYVHERGIIHRDLKPSNVFVAKDGRREHVKIFDFGVAGDRKGIGSDAPEGEMVGTPEYMAPEQLFGEAAPDHRCDIYSVGVTLYECLTGDVPYGGQYAQILMQLAQAKQPPSARALRDDVSEELDEVIACALDPQPNERFETAHALGRALARATGIEAGDTALLRGAGPSIPVPLVVPSAAQPRRDDTAPIPLVRRLLERMPYVTSAKVLHGGEVIEGRTEDISVGGMLVRVDVELPPGAPVRVQFPLPLTNEPADVAATVRWSRAGRGGHAIGVQFLDLPSELRRVITGYVQQP